MKNLVIITFLFLSIFTCYGQSSKDFFNKSNYGSIEGLIENSHIILDMVQAHENNTHRIKLIRTFKEDIFSDIKSDIIKNIINPKNFLIKATIYEFEFLIPPTEDYGNEIIVGVDKPGSKSQNIHKISKDSSKITITDIVIDFESKIFCSTKGFVYDPKSKINISSNRFYLIAYDKILLNPQYEFTPGMVGFAPVVLVNGPNTKHSVFLPFSNNPLSQEDREFIPYLLECVFPSNKKEEENIFKTNLSEVTLSFWDDGAFDGDMVSIYVNGSPILEKFKIERKQKLLTIPLDLKKITTVTFFPESEGSISGCSLRFRIHELFFGENLHMKIGEESHIKIYRTGD